MIIPLASVPNQTFSINLDGQNCKFELVTRGKNLFMNLSIDDTPVVNGVICLNKVKLIQFNHLKFNGNLYFEDLEGNLDPYFWGLGERWVLNYVQ